MALFIRYGDDQSHNSPEPKRITLSGWSTSRGLAAVTVPAWLSSLGHLEHILWSYTR